MKYLIFVLFTFTFSCAKPELTCECMKVFTPKIINPVIFEVPCNNVIEFDGKTGSYIDNLGNYITYEIICR
jgi:hypothetical protein